MAGFDHVKILENLWSDVRRNLISRVKYSTIISCEEQYKEALKIARFVFGEEVEDLRS